MIIPAVGFQDIPGDFASRNVRINEDINVIAGRIRPGSLFSALESRISK